VNANKEEKFHPLMHNATVARLFGLMFHISCAKISQTVHHVFMSFYGEFFIKFHETFLVNGIFLNIYYHHYFYLLIF